VRTDHGDLAELLDYCDRTVAVLHADGKSDAVLAALLPSDVSRVQPTVDPAWLGRRLARASVGVAFGAGGAKGWAHVGVLRRLQRAGYVVDAVAGSSIGAWVGAWTALGHEAGSVGQLLRDRFDASGGVVPSAQVRRVVRTLSVAVGAAGRPGARGHGHIADRAVAANITRLRLRRSDGI
jgi:hypothetical protein